MADTRETAGNVAMVDNFCTPENRAFYESGIYQPLDNQRREIRLLTVDADQRGQLKMELEGDLPLADLAGSYWALSYAAGDHTQTEAVRISAGSKTSDFNAFATLARAIRAICINQSDLEERAYQVEHMREIYETAGFTAIYLGEDEHNGRGWRFLELILEDCLERLDGSIDRIRASGPVAERIVNYVKTPGHAEDWRALEAVFKVPWWRRGWICQEAVVSRDSIIFYGSFAMSFTLFGLVTWHILQAGRILASEAMEVALGTREALIDYRNLGIWSFQPCYVAFIMNTVAHWEDTSGTPFNDIKPLLRHARGCETGDPRDRVYAFIGLADPSYGIRPDYRLTAPQTFANAAAHIMARERSLEVIFDAMSNPETPGLPSWAADWSSPARRTRRRYPQGVSASADHPGRARLTFQSTAPGLYGPVLRIQALRLGRPSVPERFGRVEEGQDVEVTCRSWTRIAGFQDDESHDDLYVGGGSLEDAFRSTLVFGGSIDDEIETSDLVGLGADIISRFESFRRRMRTEETMGGGWSFFVTAGGYMGLAVSSARHDDYLCIALGASVPMVLRKVGSCYSFIGEAYVHGLMHGEAIKLMEEGRLPLREIDVV